MRRKNLLWLLLIFFLLVAGGICFYQLKIVKAAQKVLTSRVDFNAGVFDRTESWSREGEVKLVPDGSWNPRIFKTPKITLSNQSAIVSDGEDVYLLASSDKYFAKYLSKEDRWVTLAQAPQMAMGGADLVISGNYIYAIFGNYSKDFYRYSIPLNSWEKLNDAPDLIGDGGSLETDGTSIFVIRGLGSLDFWKYNPITQTWTTLATPPASLGAGASLVYKNGYIYTARGQSTQTYYRYSVADNTWLTMTNIPATVGVNHNATLFGENIYLNRDGNTTTFYRYNLPDTSLVGAVSIVNPGINYVAGAFSVDNTGTGGSGFAANYTVAANGSISSITVTSVGRSYESMPVLIPRKAVRSVGISSGGAAYVAGSFDVDNTGTGGSGFAATYTVSGGVINGITITNNGDGYNSAPVLTPRKAVYSVGITSGGSRYVAGSFTVDNTGTGGSGFAATYTVSGGVINGITITNNGAGYSLPPVLIPRKAVYSVGYTAGIGYSAGALVVNNTGTGGSGFAGTYTVDGSGRINGITITNNGDGYNTPPIITPQPGGSGAVLTGLLGSGAILAPRLGSGAAFIPVLGSGAVLLPIRSDTGSWNQILDLPQASQYVGTVGVGNTATGYVYAFRGNTTYDFWKYNPRTNSFLGLADLPNTPSTGADFSYMNDKLYFKRGNSSANMYHYGIGGTWTALTSAPVTFADDTRGVKVGNVFYTLRGSGTNTFYKYDPNSGVGGTWIPLLNTPAAMTINYGSALVYPGTGNYLYATRGGLSRVFMRYTIGTGETWDDAAATDLPDNAEAGYGSRMISDGTDIYYIAGSGIAKMFKYTIGTTTWSEVTNLPFSPYYGTDITYYNGKIYALAGNYKKDLWEYTIGGSWRLLPQIQDYGPTELGPWTGATIENDGSGNFYIQVGNGIPRLFNYSVGTSNYVLSGNWTSEVQDLNYVSNWEGLVIGSSLPEGTSIGWESRTSSDRIAWEEWRTGVGTSIPSTPNRYIQLRVSLTSNGNQSPILESITINYSGDITPPSTPINFSGWSQQVAGIGLSSGANYSYIWPYFNWDDSIDLHTNISGYYVYFGNNENANPQTDGFFQTDSSYTVSQTMNQENNFLRVVAVDVVGNTSPVVTGFVYGYNGVAPPSSFGESLTTAFGLGTTDKVNITGDEIKLNNKLGFWKQNRLALWPGAIYYGSGMVYSASRDKIFILRGNNSNLFYQYDLTTNIASTLPFAPATVYYGSDLVEGPSGYLYASRGYNSLGFWRYDLNTGVWSDIEAADLPQPMSYGGSLVFDGERYIYALKGNNDDTFMKYDVLSNTWEVIANVEFGAPIEQINNLVNDGGDLAYGEDNQIYAIQGGGRTGFAVFNVNSGTWTRLTKLPVMAGYGASIEYDSDNHTIYFIPGYGRNYFYKYDLANQTWTQLADIPNVTNAGAALKKIGNYIYLTLGNSQLLYRYDITNNYWIVPAMGLFDGWFRGSDARTFTTGANIVKGDGDYYYLTRGNYDNLFVRYNSVTGESVKMADAPAGFTTGGALVYDNVNNKIYATTSVYYRKLFVYDITNNNWSEETSDPPPFDSADGSSMSFDGSRYIYWTRGGGNTTFYKFDIQGVGTSKWIPQPNVSLSINSGGDILYKNGYVYALRGGSTVGFLRFNVGTITWSDVGVTDLPTGITVGNDGFLVNVNSDKLMACRGLNTNTCYEYSISGDSWTAVNGNFGPNITSGGAAASDGDSKISVIAGAGADGTFSNGVYSYISQSNNSAFETTGSYISQVQDLSMVYKFGDITIGVSMPVNTDLNVYTRSSADNITWDDWILGSNKRVIGNNWVYKINSRANRYFQVKLVLISGDGIRTGIIYDYNLDYYQDIDEPTNPSVLEARLNINSGETMVSGVFGNSTAPYFGWSGASDGVEGSGLAGYYSYFGLGETADPVALGTYTTANSTIGTSLVSGQKYYFRLKTKDNAGNVTSEVGTTFVYNFDNTPPTNPSTISADPPGYTATNSFKFTWSAAQDVGSSIAAYCYKVGLGGSESCIEGAGITGVSDLQAYQTGTNTFYLRTKDLANNYSSDYATASFYYSSVAPGAPKNLSVGQSSNTVNEFSFSWQPPDLFYGQQSGLRYYYSVNETPSATNVNETGLSVTYLSTGAYATRNGKNTLYVVVKDEAGNIDYNNYSYVDFFAETSAPGIPLNVDISDVSVKETSNWRLAISWETPEATGSGVASYKMYRSKVTGAECSTDMTDFTQVSSTTNESFVDTNLAQVKYFYCIKACDSTNECSAPSSTVSYTPDGKWRVAPTLIGTPEATAKTKSAIITWSTSRTSSSFVKYGKSSGSYGDEVGTSEQVAAHTISLTGLDPGATYYYKTLWTDEDGNTGESTESTFSTNPAPTISTVKISDVSLYSAYVTFTIKSAIKVSIQYGKTTSYGDSVEVTTSTTENQNSIKLENLEQGTKYHLRIQAYDEEDNIFTSDDYIFETLPLPKLLNVKVQQVKGMPIATLRLLWQSNTSVSSMVTYYPTGKAEMAKDQVKLTMVKNHEIIIRDLVDDTDYTIVVKGKDKVGNSAESVTQKFKTSADMRPPTISNISVETVVSGLGDEAKAQAIIYWDTDEGASSQVEYGQGTGNDYPNKTQKDSNLTLNHSVTISDLEPSQVYHLRILTEDKMGNLSQSYDNVVITPKETSSALNLVIENLSKSFGFIGGLGGKK